MKNKFILFFCILLFMTMVISGCINDNGSSSTPSDIDSTDDSSEISDNSETSDEVSEEEVKEVLTNLTFTNKGTRENGFLMGDTDGPAYCVYSKIGYNKASFEVDLSNIKIKLKRQSDGKHINAYLFLGADIYKPSTEYWVNCIDAGLVMSGGGGGWHLFHSLYSVDDTFTGNKWYESKKVLNPRHTYRIELDASEKDGEATLTAYDLTDGGKVADSVTFPLHYALKNGENVRLYQDYALDYPPNTKIDTEGNPSEDWEEITLYNSDEGLYMKNVRIENVTISNNDEDFIWTDEHTQERGMWPDTSVTKIDYEIVKVKNPVFDSYIWFDYDMNR